MLFYSTLSQMIKIKLKEKLNIRQIQVITIIMAFFHTIDIEKKKNLGESEQSSPGMYPTLADPST